MTLPLSLFWGWGANRVGLEYPSIDRARCTECGYWSHRPAFYELDRLLCERCHASRGAVVLQVFGR